MSRLFIRWLLAFVVAFVSLFILSIALLQSEEGADEAVIRRLALPGLTLVRERIAATADQPDAVSTPLRIEMSALSRGLGYPVLLSTTCANVAPASACAALRNGAEELVLFEDQEEFFVAATIDARTVARLGPLPRFPAVVPSHALWVLALIVAVAVVVLFSMMRPLARQLRSLETAAQQFSEGNWEARVSQELTGAEPVAKSFNRMAARTASLIRAQQDLLQAVSHEVRTPLARLQFSRDLLADARSTAEQTRYLAAMDRDLSAIDDLIGEVLEYVRLQTSERSIALLPVVLDEEFEKYRRDHRDTDSQIEGTFGDGGPSMVISADRRLFRRALGNLVRNAFAHARTRVLVRAHATSSTRVTIEVHDDGPGIPAVDRQRVLQPFVRLPKAEEDRAVHASGVGLGLAIVQRIVAAHDGLLEIRDSAPLGGACIAMSFRPATVDVDDSSPSPQ